MSNLITKARDYARQQHGGQVRKYNGRPYFEHPERVAIETLKLPGSTDDMVAAAYLHDVPEDCWVYDDFNHLNNLFINISWAYNSDVSRIVRGLTSWSKQIKSTEKRAERKKMDLEYLTRQQSDVHQLKLIDRYANLCDLQDDYELELLVDHDFVKLYVKETKELLKVIEYANEHYTRRIESLCYTLLNGYGPG
jgi:(p)ppGpp synthase/HD superfamily hydrolase